MLINIISNHQFQHVSSLRLENKIAWRVLKIFSKEEADYWEIGWFFVMLSPKPKLRKKSILKKENATGSEWNYSNAPFLHESRDQNIIETRLWTLLNTLATA